VDVEKDEHEDREEEPKDRPDVREHRFEHPVVLTDKPAEVKEVDDVIGWTGPLDHVERPDHRQVNDGPEKKGHGDGDAGTVDTEQVPRLNRPTDCRVPAGGHEDRQPGAGAGEGV